MRSERGIVLPLALGVLTVLSISAVTVVDFSSSNSRSAARSQKRDISFVLAEAGINNALSVLSKSGNNNLSQSLLPACTNNAETNWVKNDGGTPPVEYEGGYVRWCGDLDLSQNLWRIKSTGIVRNPESAQEIRKTLSAVVPLTPIVTQSLANESWNYMFSTRTGTAGGCDMTFSNNVTIGSNVYVMGNLCLDQNVVVSSPKAIVLGKIDLENNARIGTSGTNNWSTRVEVQVGGSGGLYCVYGNQHWHAASNADGHPFCGDIDHIYSKNGAQTAMTVSSSPQALVPPVVDWAGWYEQAIPGPKTSCTTTSGTVPVWDNNTTRADVANGSVPTVFELAPAGVSYTCRAGSASDPIGELSWNHTTKVLTVRGTMFIDGSLKLTNTAVNTYTGYATIYLSGTFLMDNGAKLCAAKNANGDDCDYAGWDPNTRLLAISANGDGSLAGVGSQTGSTTSGGGNSVKLVNNTRFQGALYATKAIQLQNNSKTDGPMIASTIVVDNNVAPDSFPIIYNAPAGMPGNTAVFAQTNPPQLFSG